jgi:hypothetical protein
MAYLMNRIKQELAKEGYAPRSIKARSWLQNKVGTLKPTAQSLLKDKERMKNRTFIGRMYFFYYDPKGKEKLAYYDRFPLVVPIEQYSDGFLGLNLHYIHPKQRILLLDKLSEFASNRNFDERTRLKLSYDILRTAASAFQATPCIKRYLFSHVQSRFLEITADEWDIAALLPVEQFVGAPRAKVWDDSKEQF